MLTGKVLDPGGTVRVVEQYPGRQGVDPNHQALRTCVTHLPDVLAAAHTAPLVCRKRRHAYAFSVSLRKLPAVRIQTIPEVPPRGGDLGISRSERLAQRGDINALHGHIAYDQQRIGDVGRKPATRAMAAVRLREL